MIFIFFGDLELDLILTIRPANFKLLQSKLILTSDLDIPKYNQNKDTKTPLVFEKLKSRIVTQI